MSKLVLLGYDYPPNDGGISRLSASLVEGLAREGQSVEVLTLHNDDRVGPARPQVPTTPVPRSGWRRDLATLRFILRQPRDAALVAAVWNPEGTLAWLAGRSRQLWVMAHGNEVMPYPPGLRFTFKRWLRRRMLASARVVVCNSRYTERLVNAASPQARTVAIPLGVDAQRFQSPLGQAEARARFGLPQQERVVLSVSRLNAHKGHDTVLRALAALPIAERNRVCYVIAGRGKHAANLQAFAAELGVDEHVRWLGYVREDELPMLYAAADLFALCSREDQRERGVEGFGLAFLEAQAAGVPVLGTRAGGIPDAVEDGRGGWLVAQDDVAAVRDHLARLVAAPALFAAQGLAARKRAETECGWGIYVDRFRAVLGQRPAVAGGPQENRQESRQ
ncbi:glycosyltransferase family 4 protein [Luteimonas sp. MJ250]|uniref:glycosyltransferase family 4 protein n=1 Tax=Luteimonas sp. MJ250 TaxID=3129236 RepID=UPI0031BA5340